MPRHAKRDREATKLAQFLDRRSFVTLPSIHDGKAHLRLYGADVASARERAFKRASIGHGATVCQVEGCNRLVSDLFSDWHPSKAEMDHIERRRGMRCDCDHNLRIICKSCHDKKHGH